MTGDRRFDRQLHDAFAALPASPGACPPREELERLHAGEVPEARAAELNDHVLRCTDCDLMLDRMERFDGIVRDEAGVRGAVGNAASKLPAPAGSAGPYWRPALCGALAASVLLLIPMWRLRRVEVAREPASSHAVQLFVIPQDRASAPAATLERTSDAVVLSFFAPMRQGPRYSATIVRDGRPVVGPVDITATAQTGTVNVIVPAASIPPGAYLVRVIEAAGSPETKVLEELPFEVGR